MTDDLLEQLATRNRHRAQLAQRKANAEAEAARRREQGFDVCFSGANTDRINDKLQQPTTRRRRAQSARAQRDLARPDVEPGGFGAAPRRGWQQAPVSLLAADGRQLEVRPRWAIAEHSDGEEQGEEEGLAGEVAEEGEGSPAGAQLSPGTATEPMARQTWAGAGSGGEEEDAFDAYERDRIGARRQALGRDRLGEGDSPVHVRPGTPQPHSSEPRQKMSQRIEHRAAHAEGINDSSPHTHREKSIFSARDRPKAAQAEVASAGGELRGAASGDAAHVGGTSMGGLVSGAASRLFEQRLARAQRNAAAVAMRRQQAQLEERELREEVKQQREAIERLSRAGVAGRPDFTASTLFTGSAVFTANAAVSSRGRARETWVGKEAQRVREGRVGVEAVQVEEEDLHPTGGREGSDAGEIEEEELVAEAAADVWVGGGAVGPAEGLAEEIVSEPEEEAEELFLEARRAQPARLSHFEAARGGGTQTRQARVGRLGSPAASLDRGINGSIGGCVGSSAAVGPPPASPAHHPGACLTAATPAAASPAPALPSPPPAVASSPAVAGAVGAPVARPISASIAKLFGGKKKGKPRAIGPAWGLSAESGGVRGAAGTSDVDASVDASVDAPARGGAGEAPKRGSSSTHAAAMDASIRDASVRDVLNRDVFNRDVPTGDGASLQAEQCSEGDPPPPTLPSRLQELDPAKARYLLSVLEQMESLERQGLDLDLGQTAAFAAATAAAAAAAAVKKRSGAPTTGVRMHALTASPKQASTPGGVKRGDASLAAAPPPPAPPAQSSQPESVTVRCGCSGSTSSSDDDIGLTDALAAAGSNGGAHHPRARANSARQRPRSARRLLDGVASAAGDAVALRAERRPGIVQGRRQSSDSIGSARASPDKQAVSRTPPSPSKGAAAQRRGSRERRWVRPEVSPERDLSHAQGHEKLSTPQLKGVAGQLISPGRRAPQLRASPPKPAASPPKQTASRSPQKKPAGSPPSGGPRGRANTDRAQGGPPFGGMHGPASLASGGPARQAASPDASEHLTHDTSSNASRHAPSHVPPHTSQDECRDVFDDRHAFDPLAASLTSLSAFCASHAGRLDRRGEDWEACMRAESANPPTAPASAYLAGTAVGCAPFLDSSPASPANAHRMQPGVGRPDGADAFRDTRHARGGSPRLHSSASALRSCPAARTCDSPEDMAVSYSAGAEGRCSSGASARCEGGAFAASGARRDELTFDLLSTWGDAHFIGLTALQIFDEGGELLSVDAARQVRGCLGGSGWQQRREADLRRQQLEAGNHRSSG
jgi:hypothetical protein